MTWGEWVNSKYNTQGAYVHDDGYIAFEYNGETYIIYDYSPVHVNASMLIEAGYSYGDEQYFVPTDE